MVDAEGDITTKWYEPASAVSEIIQKTKEMCKLQVDVKAYHDKVKQFTFRIMASLLPARKRVTLHLAGKGRRTLLMRTTSTEMGKTEKTVKPHKSLENT